MKKIDWDNVIATFIQVLAFAIICYNNIVLCMRYFWNNKHGY